MILIRGRSKGLQFGRSDVMWFSDLSSQAAWTLKMPWSTPLFGERIGARRPIAKVLGFRLFVREKEERHGTG